MDVTDVGELFVLTRPLSGEQAAWREGPNILTAVGKASGGTVTITGSREPIGERATLIIKNMGKLSGIPPYLGDKSRPPDWKEALFKVGEKPLEPARTLQCTRRYTQSPSVPALALSSCLPKL